MCRMAMTISTLLPPYGESRSVEKFTLFSHPASLWPVHQDELENHIALAKRTSGQDYYYQIVDRKEDEVLQAKVGYTPDCAS